VTGKAEQSLRKLQSTANNLNQASDELNAQLTAIEEVINGFKLGVSAWVQAHKEKLNDPQMGELSEITMLGYGKYKGKWALLYDTFIEELYGGEDDAAFLRDAPREVRIKVIEAIPQLLDKLADETEKFTAEVSSVIPKAKEMAEGLRKGTSSEEPASVKKARQLLPTRPGTAKS
jgi:hypothetical protein